MPFKNPERKREYDRLYQRLRRFRTTGTGKNILSEMTTVCRLNHEIDPNTAQCVEGHPIYHARQVNAGKVAFWDIEANEIRDAGFGYIYCWALKLESGKVIHSVITRDEILGGEYDKRVIQEFVKAIIENDVSFVVTWYGKWYDFRFVRTRAMLTGTDFFKYGQLYHWDIWQTARNKFMFGSNRLAHVSDEIQEWGDFLGIESVPKKTKVQGIKWVRAQVGAPDALAEILDHCIRDVNVLEAVYKRFNGVWKKAWTSI